MNIMMFGHSGSLNRGCEAIVRSSNKIIKDTIKESMVYVASLRPETDKVINNIDKVIDGRSVVIKKYSYHYVISAVLQKILKDESYALRRMYKRTIDNIKEMDICLSIGGDAYCYGEQHWMYEIDKSIKKVGKKLVLWGASIGEEDMSHRKLDDLKAFDLILARESLTYDMLIQKGLNNVKLCADPAFTLEKEKLPLPKGWTEGNVVGLNFSPLVVSRNKESEEAFRDLIKHILNITDLTIALTPHVTEPGNNDFELLNKYYEEFKDSGRVIILPDNLTAVQYKGYIARMKFFIGARTHATIAAYSSCIPTMVLGYSVKSKGIAKDLFGEEKLVLGIKDISQSDKLINKFNEMIIEEKEIKEKLEKVIPVIKRRSYKAVEYLKEIVK